MGQVEDPSAPRVAAEELARARAYQAQQARQAAYRRANLNRLKGDPAARARLAAKAQPVLDAIREGRTRR